MKTFENLFVRVFNAFAYWMLIVIMWGVISWLFRVSTIMPRMIYYFLKALAESLKKEFASEKK